MSEIGYYNYYNNPHRYSPDTVQDRYNNTNGFIPYGTSFEA